MWVFSDEKCVVYRWLDQLATYPCQYVSGNNTTTCNKLRRGNTFGLLST